MANTPVSKSPSSLVSDLPVGPKLVGLGVGLFVLTRVVNWLPLGFVGSAINAALWPILLLSVIAGAGLMVLKSKRS